MIASGRDLPDYVHPQFLLAADVRRCAKRPGCTPLPRTLSALGLPSGAQSRPGNSLFPKTLLLRRCLWPTRISATVFTDRYAGHVCDGAGTFCDKWEDFGRPYGKGQCPDLNSAWSSVVEWRGRRRSRSNDRLFGCSGRARD